MKTVTKTRHATLEIVQDKTKDEIKLELRQQIGHGQKTDDTY